MASEKFNRTRYREFGLLLGGPEGQVAVIDLERERGHRGREDATAAVAPADVGAPVAAALLEADQRVARPRVPRLPGGVARVEHRERGVIPVVEVGAAGVGR